MPSTRKPNATAAAGSSAARDLRYAVAAAPDGAVASTAARGSCRDHHPRVSVLIVVPTPPTVGSPNSSTSQAFPRTAPNTATDPKIAVTGTHRASTARYLPGSPNRAHAG